MVKQKLLTMFILLGVTSIYAVSAPYVTVPAPLDNVIHLDNSSDYAAYKVTLANPTNETYYYYFQEVSISWIFVYDKGIHLISPGEEVTKYIKIRPTKKTSEIPILLVVFERNGKKISYPLYFSPLIISKQKQISENLTLGNITFDVQAIKRNVRPGEPIQLFITINNPFREKKNVTIRISSEILSKDIKTAVELKEGRTLITVPLRISTAALPGEYNVNIYVDGSYKTVHITVTKQPHIDVIVKNNIIYITNLDNFVNEYTFKREVTFGEKLMYTYKPKPDYEIVENGAHYYVWNFVLMPGETVTIEKTANWFNIFIFTLLIVLSIAYLLLSYLSPKVSIKKEILKIDTKNREIKIMLSIKNNSVYKIRNIKVTEVLLPIFEPTDKYEFVKPVGSYTKDGKIYIEWLIEELLPGEERLIVYTVKYKSEVVGELEIDPAVAEFSVFNKKYVVKSNKLTLKFV